MNLRRFPFAVFSLLAAPALAADEPPICTDRPAKANATCTVPAGNFQLESSFAQRSRIESGGAETGIWQVGGSVLKYGLSNRSDLQVGFTPYVDIDSGPSHVSGIGDLTIRYKHRLTGDAAKIQVAVIPFVKLPTAKQGIGNGKAEGGLAVPISIATGSPVTVVLGPEVDLLADSDGDGHHLQLVNVVNVSASVAPRLTLAGEFWTATNFDPASNVTQVSLDGAAAYAVSNRLQLDAGTNIGINRHTPGIEVYAGVSIRF